MNGGAHCLWHSKGQWIVGNEKTFGTDIGVLFANSLGQCKLTQFIIFNS